ncbi:MAG: aminoacyl-tRNA hydrolase [Prevotellaceae bacterium]|jgi:PTH1 family peptidyl-tRNA hydrolase|nr:aminoacyl-tRNA hydrolase [Prevotellaceae bacterium]
MKFLIACLGNIGPEYANTRHNVGFRVGDTLASEAGLRFETKRYGSIAELRHKGRALILLKPSTYMNLSGEAVRYWLQAEKIERENLLVVVDDINLPFGQLRLRGGGSDGGHNGLKSIAQLLETQAYVRLRCGVGASFGAGRQIDYVLGEWAASEAALLPHLCTAAADAVKAFATAGLERAMNAVNTVKTTLPQT